MDYKMATLATTWWINQIKKRCKELYPHKITGDDYSNLVIIDDSLQQEISHFQELLFKQILHHVESKLYLSLTCYFWPSGELSVLARKACIPTEYFPHRAQMQICGTSVEVSINGGDLYKLRLPS